MSTTQQVRPQLHVHVPGNDQQADTINSESVIREPTLNGIRGEIHPQVPDIQQTDNMDLEPEILKAVHYEECRRCAVDVQSSN